MLLFALEESRERHVGSMDPLPRPARRRRRPRALCADPERLRCAFDANHSWLLRVLRRLGVPPRSIDDVAQQVFVLLARKIGAVDRDRERSFLFGVARRMARDARNAEGRDVGRMQELVDVEEDAALAPDVLVDRKLKREALDRVIDAMERDLRAVFVLHELESRAVPDIAARLGIPTGTAASRLRRARAHFRRIVTERTRKTHAARGK